MDMLGVPTRRRDTRQSEETAMLEHSHLSRPAFWLGVLPTGGADALTHNMVCGARG